MIQARAILNLVNLTTPLGLALALAGGAQIRRSTAGLWFGEGYRFPFPRAAAFTVGDVVTASATLDVVQSYLPDVIGHEERHAWQYAATGLAFLPLYGAAAIASWLGTRSWAALNPFERHAGLASGGYLAS